MKGGYQVREYPADHFNGGFIHYFGWVSLDGSVNVSPPSVIIGQEFSITFTLKETVGRPKTFERMAVAILNDSGELVYDAKIFENVRIGANEAWTRTATRCCILACLPVSTGWLSGGKLPGDDWFDFDIVGGGSNAKPFHARVSDSPGISCGVEKIHDCNLNCVDEHVASEWTGDGYCDDAGYPYGYVLTCPAFLSDNGDCGP